MVFEEKGKNLVIFGGADEEGPLDSIFAYSLEKSEWREVINKFKGLSAREMHTSHVFYSESAEFLAKKQGICEKKQEICAEQQGNPEKSVEKTQGNADKSQKIIEVSFDFPEESCTTPQLLQKLPQPIAKTELNFEEEHKSPEKPAVFPSSAYLLIIGGRTSQGISNEILAVNLAENSSFLLKTLPHGLCAHSSFLRNDELFLYGGTDGFGFLNILYNYRINSDILFKVSLDEEIKGFQARIAASVTSFCEGELVIFGGSGFEEEKNEVLLVKTKEVGLKQVKN